MDTRAALLQSLHQDPSDEVTWLALADWLEENGESAQAELIRLHRSLPPLRPSKKRYAIEERIQQLLATVVKNPCVPTLTNSIGMKLALIPPGKFRMGSPTSEARRMEDETLHTVRITRPFYMGIYPVTQAEYRAITRRNPSEFQGKEWQGPDRKPDRFPVDTVPWWQAVAFCELLSKRKEEKAAGRVYRLPTEAEWEYACRAWGSPAYPFHLGKSLEEGQANFRAEYEYPPYSEENEPIAADGFDRPCEVGRYAANAFGLFDMHGNIDEWTSDFYDADYYSRSPQDDPQGPAEGDSHVVRGGSWSGQGEDCRAAVRIGYEDDFESSRVGMRVVMTIEKK